MPTALCLVCCLQRTCIAALKAASLARACASSTERCAAFRASHVLHAALQACRQQHVCTEATQHDAMHDSSAEKLNTMPYRC
jgi:hypothetical protein